VAEEPVVAEMAGEAAVVVPEATFAPSLENYLVAVFPQGQKF
jgi:hypothetical protein